MSTCIQANSLACRIFARQAGGGQRAGCAGPGAAGFVLLLLLPAARGAQSAGAPGCAAGGADGRYGGGAGGRCGQIGRYGLSRVVGAPAAAVLATPPGSQFRSPRRPSRGTWRRRCTRPACPRGRSLRFSSCPRCCLLVFGHVGTCRLFGRGVARRAEEALAVAAAEHVCAGLWFIPTLTYRLAGRRRTTGRGGREARVAALAVRLLLPVVWRDRGTRRAETE